MMGFFFVIILYTLVFVNGDLYTFTIIDLIISLYLAVNLDKSSLKNKLLFILIIPYGSLTFLLFGDTLIGILDLIHIPVYIYFIKLYYDKFKEYTESHSLGITIILLFTIILSVSSSHNLLKALIPLIHLSWFQTHLQVTDMPF